MSKVKTLFYKCCICKQSTRKTIGNDNNPEPVVDMYKKNGSRNMCCSFCNDQIVVPTRWAEHEKIKRLRMLDS